MSNNTSSSDSNVQFDTNVFIPILLTIIVGIFKNEILNIINRYNIYTNRRFKLKDGQPVKLQIKERNKWKNIEIKKYVLYVPFRHGTGVHIDYLKKGNRRATRIIDFLTWYHIGKREYVEQVVPELAPCGDNNFYPV